MKLIILQVQNHPNRESVYRTLSWHEHGIGVVRDINAPVRVVGQMDHDGTRLTVVENAEQTIDCREDNQRFVIYDEICEYDVSEAKSILGDFVRADIGSSFPYPIYPILIPNLCEKFGYARSSFIYGIILFETLSNYIEEKDVTHVSAENVDPFFEMVILDVCRQNSVETTISPPRRRSSNIIAYVSVVISIIPFFLDQLFSIFYRRFVEYPDKADTILAVFPDRFDSIRPVIEEMNEPYEIITTPTTIAHLRTARFSELVDEYDASPMNLFVTLSTLTAELRFLFGGVRRELIGARQLESNLHEFIFQRYGCELTYTSWWITNDVLIGKNIKSFMYYFVLDTVIEELEPQKLVTNSFSTKGRSITAAGEARGLDQYHVPHSLFATGFVPLPYRITSFVPGSIEKDFISEQVDIIENEEDFLPEGRPYVCETYQNRHQYPVVNVKDDSESLLITLATQPFEDEARKRLVEGALTAIEHFDEEPTLLIKTHPSEDPSFYDTYSEANTNVIIESEHLFSVLAESDIVVTVNSNVGFESMLFGTPCLCFNEWETMMWNMPYTELGPIPVFHSPSELGEFFASVTEEELRSLSQTQEEFVETNYILDGAAAGIAGVIEDESRAVTTQRP